LSARSKRKNEWVVALADVLAAHYCCCSYRTRKKGKQINTIMLTGFPEDTEVCTGIMKYAIPCINSWILKMEKNSRKIHRFMHAARSRARSSAGRRQSS